MTLDLLWSYTATVELYRVSTGCEGRVKRKHSRQGQRRARQTTWRNEGGDTDNPGGGGGGGRGRVTLGLR